MTWLTGLTALSLVAGMALAASSALGADGAAAPEAPGLAPTEKPAAQKPAPTAKPDAAPADGKAPAPAKKARVLLLTGGHDFEEKPFLALFDANADISYKHVAEKVGGEAFSPDAGGDRAVIQQPTANQRRDISTFPYDVIVLYNHARKLTAAQQQNFLSLLEKGVGLVVLHHAIAAYDGWREFEKIVGGRYYLSAVDEGGVKHPASNYKHDVDFTVHIQDTDHPITRGLKDFKIHDETYIGCSFDPKIHVLLTTDERTSDKTIGWTHSYAKARVAYLMGGHDHVAYANESFRALVARAIRWAAPSEAK